MQKQQKTAPNQLHQNVLSWGGRHIELRTAAEQFLIQQQIDTCSLFGLNLHLNMYLKKSQLRTVVTCLRGQMPNALLNSLRQMTYLKTYLFAFETRLETFNVTSKAHNLVFNRSRVQCSRTPEKLLGNRLAMEGKAVGVTMQLQESRQTKLLGCHCINRVSNCHLSVPRTSTESQSEKRILTINI